MLAPFTKPTQDRNKNLPCPQKVYVCIISYLHNKQCGHCQVLITIGEHPKSYKVELVFSGVKMNITEKHLFMIETRTCSESVFSRTFYLVLCLIYQYFQFF